jgi:hypothetical protein
MYATHHFATKRFLQMKGYVLDTYQYLFIFRHAATIGVFACQWLVICCGEDRLACRAFLGFWGCTGMGFDDWGMVAGGYRR